MQGNVVVITGASRGIGAASALVFARAGAKVALLARSDTATTALAAGLGANAMALHCDVAEASSVAAAMDAVIARWGRIDVLINNAGVIDPIARIADTDPADWGRAIDINLKGVFHGMRCAIPLYAGTGGWHNSDRVIRRGAYPLGRLGRLLRVKGRGGHVDPCSASGGSGAWIADHGIVAGNDGYTDATGDQGKRGEPGQSA